MKLHFDSNQPYQLQAIKSVTDIFECQPLSNGDFEFSLNVSRCFSKEFQEVEFNKLSKVIDLGETRFAQFIARFLPAGLWSTYKDA